MKKVDSVKIENIIEVGIAQNTQSQQEHFLVINYCY